MLIHVAICLSDCSNMESCGGSYITEGTRIKKTKTRVYYICGNYEGPPPQALIELFF